MTKPLNIVIVGGGTAGWMTAAALVGIVTSKAVNVRLIESDTIGTVGVGEATLPSLAKFNERVGIFEPEMMKASAATFKLGIEFAGWRGDDSSYIHPFGAHGKSFGGVDFHHHWVRAGMPGNIEDYSYAIQAARASRFDFPAEDPGAVNATYDYAYHFDAGLYAAFLRRFAEKRGLRRTEGRIIDVQLDAESGDIASLKLENGEVITGDLFVDCSGFRSVLLGEALGCKYESWKHWLPCDRAVAMACTSDGRPVPYTKATARAAGWQWRIPLQHRTGNGYVYSSDHANDDMALDTLCRHLDGEPLGDAKILSFEAGRRQSSWYKNCVAIGLSSGFLEPLESTSIYLVQIGIVNLIDLLPGTGNNDALRTEYNRQVDMEYSRVRDFLILHYHANGRHGEALWDHCRHMDIPDSLQEKIELFRHRGDIEQASFGLFSPPSWLAVFAGQGVVPQNYNRLADNLDRDNIDQKMDAYRQSIASRVKTMPEHSYFLADYCPSNVRAMAATKGGTA
ncbi:tryptophan halogenase family protein [Parvularcula sp. LCG005]|uniref:tryptophan halogenase family protein n=1 Tax=Parvularcula sp. LCG005 TaxID=3078805 RepID=UPI0029422819|nr:tryptophan halogenase family protein [Parvularcula sp. LCG005]WOI53452.1 tryptophan halogenase family protein [Parvularcula sp. LCG005]